MLIAGIKRDISMLVMDFDDTLFHGNISKRAMFTISLAHEKGCEVGIISGSPISNILKKLSTNKEILQYIDFIGSSNGALIYQKGRTTKLVSNMQIQQLEYVKNDFQKYSKCGLIIDTGYSIGILTKDKGIQNKIKQSIYGKYSTNNLFISTWNSGISVVLITKYKAMRKYCQLRKVEPVTLAIGDSENDIPLFLFSREREGVSCVVGNSTLTSSLIDYKSPLEFGDGVADCIEKYVLAA